MASQGVIKLATSISDLVKRHVKPLAAAIAPPEVLTITSFSGNAGSAISKKSGAVSIKSSIELTPGTSAVGVPIGPKEFYIVGYY